MSDYKVNFELIESNSDITGDNAVEEPGNFSFLKAHVEDKPLYISETEMAYFYVEVPYRMGGKDYTRLSWQLEGPAYAASPEGILYSIASYITFKAALEELKGTIYVRSLLS